jgi:hypothetical protein
MTFPVTVGDVNRYVSMRVSGYCLKVPQTNDETCSTLCLRYMLSQFKFLDLNFLPSSHLSNFKDDTLMAQVPMAQFVTDIFPLYYLALAPAIFC